MSVVVPANQTKERSVDELFAGANFEPKFDVNGEGVKSARGEIAMLGRGDHTRNMFGRSLHTT